MNQRINILIADDHNYFLDGLQNDIKNIDKAKAIYRANNGEEILEIIENGKIDLLISDIQMPRLDGLQTARIIRKLHKNIKIIILTSFYDIKHIKALLKLDIKVILDKENVKSILSDAIDAVFENKNFYSPLIKSTVNQITAGKRKIKVKHAIPELTRREKELLELIATGLSNKEIAKKVILSPATIDSHRTNIYLKFEVNNAAKLAVKAFRYGIIE